MLSNDNRLAIQTLRETLTLEARLAAAIELLQCDFGEDNDGQILLYTDMAYDSHRCVVVFNLPEDGEE